MGNRFHEVNFLIKVHQNEGAVQDISMNTGKKGVEYVLNTVGYCLGGLHYLYEKIRMQNTIKILPILSWLLLFFFGSHKLHAQYQQGSLPLPKNIIILIGDGMGYNHVFSTDYYFGTPQQAYEEFPVRMALSHYPAKAGEYVANRPASNYFATGYNPKLAWSNPAYLKKNFTESAAAATAMACGFKTYNNAIGLSVDYDTLENLVERAKALGKSAGVVTSVPFSHATPAGFVAHHRVRTDYPGIARQMLLDSQCDLIMGCGNPMYDDNGMQMKGSWKDARYVGDSVLWVQFLEGSGKAISFTVQGKKKTVRDIDGDGFPDPWTVVDDLQGFRALIQDASPKRVLGCAPVYSTLQQARKMQNGETKDSPPFISPLISTVPTLSEMAAGALNILDQNPEGFFLMIEGGAIDWAAHENQKGRLIEEMKEFNDAVITVTRWIESKSSWDETLVIVSSDHETGFLWGGAPFVPVKDRGKGQLPGMQFNSKDHTNSLVPFYAKGSGSEFYRTFADERDSVRGPFIQNAEIAQLIFLLWPK